MSWNGRTQVSDKITRTKESVSLTISIHDYYRHISFMPTYC